MEYPDWTIAPIFSSLYLRDDHIELLARHGIYAMVDDTMTIVNFDALQ